MGKSGTARRQWIFIEAFDRWPQPWRVRSLPRRTEKTAQAAFDANGQYGEPTIDVGADLKCRIMNKPNAWYRLDPPRQATRVVGSVLVRTAKL